MNMATSILCAEWLERHNAEEVKAGFSQISVPHISNSFLFFKA